MLIMVTPRKFCRFNKGDSLSLGVPDPTSLTLKEIPDGGFCLSSFLVALRRDDHSKVLMGLINPSAPWDHIGALDEQRVIRFGKGWMLPSSHLIYGETPSDAASRIAAEQLGLDLKFGNPIVASDTYVPNTSKKNDTHWDIQFIFRFELEQNSISANPNWEKLDFIDYRKSLNQITRYHEDVLRSAGL